MKKIDIINEILSLYEENNNLKNEVEFLKKKDLNNNEVEIIKENEDSLEKRIYKIGLKTLFEEGFTPTYMSKSWSSNEYPDFEDWSNNSINLKDFEDISIKEFKFLYGDKIKNSYDKALDKAIERDKKEE